MNGCIRCQGFVMVNTDAARCINCGWIVYNPAWCREQERSREEIVAWMQEQERKKTPEERRDAVRARISAAMRVHWAHRKQQRSG